MPKNKFQNVIFTLIMATFMVYGMIVYNISLNMGKLTNSAFLLAFKELYIMMPIAFVLELFIVGKLASKIVFNMINENTNKNFIKYLISMCICTIMCPIMSFIATILFKNFSFAVFIETWALNFPMAIFYQLFYCGPLVRFIFSKIFK